MNFQNKDIVASLEIPVFDVFEFAPKKKKYCLMIPLFNEGNRFLAQLKKMLQLKIPEQVDIIICDANSTDGSTDHDLLKKSGISALLVRKGKGRYSTDLRMGYYWTLQRGYSGFITVDGNNKDDTSALPLFINKLSEGYDYIQGSRFVPGGKEIRTPFIRKAALKLINQPIMSHCAGMVLTDTTNGFRAYSREFLLDERVQPFRNDFYGYELIYYLPVRASELGFRCIEIPVTRTYPKGEVPSKIGGIKGNLYQLSILWHILKNDYNP
ncbi:glycosyltransferase family 2 protein [Caproicibacter fermentans]|uniref:Glycosyltransferase family 2 protein n=1 Tax=Caproicibacter fermentans TaxID=2576756 RepID=A0A7G8TFN3_9FIRM|nr:glycosyltransferase family 2 protein [Caproicibacter fermentans]QNK42424.1 glycosyltransferase family 2 protein [Caproicibacter fermentans]